MSELIRPVYSVDEPVIFVGASYFSGYSAKWFHHYIVLPKNFVEQYKIKIPNDFCFYEIEGKHSEIIENTTISETNLIDAYRELSRIELFDDSGSLIDYLEIDGGDFFNTVDVRYLLDFHRNIKDNLFSLVKDHINFETIHVEIPEFQKKKFMNFLGKINGNIL